MGIRSRTRRTRSPAETWHLPDVLVRPWFEAADRAAKLRLRNGEYLYRQGDKSAYFYLVLSGRIRVSMLRENGAEFILEFMGRGAITGEGAAFDGQPRFSTAVAIEDVVVARFDATRLKSAFRENPDLPIALLHVAALKQRVLAGRAQALTAYRPESRIAEVLFRLSEGSARGKRERLVIDARLSHQQLAAMTGMSRVTVTRALRRLRLEGIIEIVDGLIGICRPERLRL